VPNNYMNLYDPRPGHALSLALGKRVTTSISPPMALRDGRLVHALGLPGGLARVGVRFGLARQRRAAKRAAATDTRLRGYSNAARTGRVLLEDRVRGVNFDEGNVIRPQIGEVLKHALRIRLAQHGSLDGRVPQHQTAIACQIDVYHFDVGIDVADVILPRQFAPNAAIAALVVDGIDPDAGGFAGIVVQMKQSQVSY
jgi:hypothetical protein